VGWRHLTLLAWAAAALGQHDQAARLLGAVEAALDRAGGKIGTGPGNAADRDRVRGLAAGAIEPNRFASLHAEGSSLPEDDADALAMSLFPADSDPAARS
jgi:hypothetical protein